MATSKPMLDDIELQQVQKIEVDEDQVLAQQSVPALEGDFLQRLGRRGTHISLTGVLTGAEAGTGLKTLQEKFRAAAPVSFVADIATSTQVEKVLIEEMGIRELAGKPSRFEYALTLREFTPPPAPEPVPPPPPTPPPPSVETGTLVVDVTVEGQPGFDFSKVTVSVEGTQDDGKSLTRTLTNRSNNSWTEENMPPGKYTVKAVVTDPQSLSGAANVTVSAGQTAKASITLQSGSLIAKAFIVHFRFDKAFVEPCMLEVLKTVVTYANAHSDEKLVIVGHTDLTGPDAYNQCLSERRGRSVYAALSYGRDKATALAEWNALRQPTDGALPSIKDSWGIREYQYMLQDLDFYSGNIDGVQGPETDAAVRDFQGSKGLTVDGIVGDQTWSALIEAYLDQYNLTIPETQFLPNCGGEILKWLGCGEQDPVKNTQDAWRPNRRTELLFVKASTLPCQVPQPETFDLPAAGAVGSKWCLGPGDKNQRNCFATRKTPQQGKWLIQPVEPETITVRGSITFDDGTPAANMKYVLIAPDGEYMDGEIPRGADHGKPIPRKTNDDGTFEYPDKPKGVGIYTMEVIAPVVARTADEPPEDAKGNVVCKRLDTTTVGAAAQRAAAVGAAKAKGLPAVVRAGKAKGPTVKPHIDLASAVVVVKKSYTSPTRQAVTLRCDTPFSGTGTFTRSSVAIRFFTAAAGGTEITFNGADNVFTSAHLTAPGGIKTFAEGTTASAALNDVQLTLTLNPSPPPAVGAALPPVGPPATAKMTAVELILDIFMSRTADGVDPSPLPQPPAVTPVPGASNDKWFGGRIVHVQDPGNHHGRALLLVQCKPTAFKGQLVLQQVVVAGNTVTGPDTKVQVFDTEFGGAAKANPHEFSASSIPAVGLKLWAEGHTLSGVLRDTGFQLGIKNLEADGDRVRMTVARLSNLQAVIPSTQPNTPRLGNGPVKDHQFSIGTAVAPVASDFDVDFVANKPLVLVEGSVVAASPIKLSVTVAPAGVPVLWDVQRDTRPAPDGDHANVIALSPNPKPTLTPDAADPLNPLKRTLQANAVGSFHILPFIDCNGNGAFDATKNREPFMTMNLVLIRVGGPGSTNSSRQQSANIGLGSFAGPQPAPGAAFAPTSATGLQVVTGSFVVPATAGIVNDATVVVVGGGNDGRRGLDRLFAGWINNELPVGTSPTVPQGEDVVSVYRDPGPPVVMHQRISIWTTSVAAGTVIVPPAVAPVLIAGPVLDCSPFGNEGQGGNLAVGTEGAIGPPPPPPGGITKTPRAPVGQSWRVQMWDSPSDACPPAHEAFPGSLVNYRFNLDFRSELCFWTNSVNITPAPTPGPVTGAVVPDAACCLYSSVQTDGWTVRVSFTFHPVTGVGTLVAKTITMNKDPNPTRLARPISPAAVHEVRAPIALNLLSTDART